MNCPLCSSQATIIIERIPSVLLEKMYLRFTGKSFNYLLNQDISKMLCERCGLIFFNPMITGDEKFYASLQEFDWYYSDDKEEYKYVKKFIKDGYKILDVGSGKGALAKLLPKCHYVGIDFSVHAKELAKEIGILIENESIQEHADKFPEEYDIVCSFQVLEHVSNPYEFIKAQLKSLKRGGLLIISVPSEDSYLKFVCNGILNLPPHHVTRWSDKTLNFIASLFALELIDLHHEMVQQIHKKDYIFTFIQTMFLKPKLIDDSFVRKIVSIVSSRAVNLIEKNFYSEFLPFGHTVIAIYRKN